MRVNPADHFSDNIGEIRPYYGGDGQKRGYEFFRRFWNSGGGYGIRLMDGAKAGVGSTAAAALAARAEVKAWALVCAFGEYSDGRRGRDAKISAVIVAFDDSPDAEIVGFGDRAYAVIGGLGERPGIEFAG